MSNRSDDFTRADSAVTMGTPSDGGSAWVPAAGTTWGIDTNRAYEPVASGFFCTVLEASTSIVEVAVTVSVIENVGGMILRYLDDNNHYRCTSQNPTGFSTVAKFIAGSGTNLASAAGVSWVNGTPLKVSVDATDLFTYTQNGVVLITVSDTFNKTATKHGLFSGGVVGRYSAFSITAPGAPLAWVGA